VSSKPLSPESKTKPGVERLAGLTTPQDTVSCARKFSVIYAEPEIVAGRAFARFRQIRVKPRRLELENYSDVK